MKAFSFFLIGVPAVAILLAATGCSTSTKMDYPEPSRLSQQDQRNDRVSRLSQSPYVRSGL